MHVSWDDPKWIAILNWNMYINIKHKYKTINMILMNGKVDILCAIAILNIYLFRLYGISLDYRGNSNYMCNNMTKHNKKVSNLNYNENTERASRTRDKFEEGFKWIYKYPTGTRCCAALLAIIYKFSWGEDFSLLHVKYDTSVIIDKADAFLTEKKK